MRKLSASGAKQMIACHASADLASAIPNWTPPLVSSGGAAKAGTNVHELIEKFMKLEYVTPSKTTKFGARDMLAFARLCQYIGELWAQRRWSVLSEVTMTATWLQSQPTTTADIVFHTQDEIHIVDSKWGTIAVDVHDNEQLMFYAVTYAALAPKAKGVTVHILQPRADNMESVFITTDELKAFMDKAVAAEAAILGGSRTFLPGDHCTFCPANPHSRAPKGSPSCPAMMDLLYPQIIEVDEILGL